MAKNDTATAAVKKKWYQFWAKTNKQIDDNADPEVQLYQAINHAKEMSRQLETDAAKVIAQEQLAEMKLAELIDQEQKLTAHFLRVVDGLVQLHFGIGVVVDLLVGLGPELVPLLLDCGGCRVVFCHEGASSLVRTITLMRS
jgi:hypothetical protein